ncbi:EAL domain-containing protein [Sphingomonas sp.]|uniref:EAL domain-containing protein n=1 Tax=Sphingomonas sp. TaxID=28214 RepID=UPI0028969C0C|nr:EAL domain-containing protein [Sphingomonas sp.]
MNDDLTRFAPGDPAPVGHERQSMGGDSSWQFLILIAIGNFATLRRHIGREQSALLAEVVAARVTGLFPDAVVRSTSSTQVEIMLLGAERAAVDVHLAVLATALARPFTVAGQPCRIEPVLAAATAMKPHEDDIRLLEEAEQALADAHIECRSVVRDLAVRVDRLDRITLARDLTHAIEHDALFVEYQPKVHVRQQRVCSIEALLRWRHPVHGMISPVEFIPVAEESRIIAPLTLWTMRRVIADQRRLDQAGHPQRIFINISGILLGDPDFVRRACALVRDSDACIGFEITETSVIRDPESAIANLQTFVDMGIALAIDDYGAGLSSLSYLKQLPACELKIDKLFITQLTSSNRDPLIVRSTIDLAHALEMEVVAEGVETPAALALLTVMGCDMVQGYLISRPIGFDALCQFLDEQAHQAVIERATPLSLGRFVAHARA